jgi:hypothetical protein
MSNLPQTVISALTLLDLGGIFGGYIAYLLDKRKMREFQVLEQKRNRYKSCLLYMDAFFEPPISNIFPAGIPTLTKRRTSSSI